MEHHKFATLPILFRILFCPVIAQHRAKTVRVKYNYLSDRYFGNYNLLLNILYFINVNTVYAIIIFREWLFFPETLSTYSTHHLSATCLLRALMTVLFSKSSSRHLQKQHPFKAYMTI